MLQAQQLVTTAFPCRAPHFAGKPDQSLSAPYVHLRGTPLNVVIRSLVSEAANEITLYMCRRGGLPERTMVLLHMGTCMHAPGANLHDKRCMAWRSHCACQVCQHTYTLKSCIAGREYGKKATLKSCIAGREYGKKASAESLSAHMQKNIHWPKRTLHQ